MKQKQILLALLIPLLCIPLAANPVYKLDLKTESSIIISSTIIGSYSYLKSKDTQKLSLSNIDNLSSNDVLYIDRIAINNYSPKASKWSDYILIGCLLAPFSLNLEKNISKDYIVVNSLILESLYLSTSIVSLSKVTFKRKRPFVYNQSVPETEKLTNDANYSFFSAHTALAFNGAYIFAKIYDDYYPDKNNAFIYTTALASASTVAYLRYKAGKHFPTDILTGALIGMGSGFLITEIHKNTKSSNNTTKPIINISFQF